MLRSAGRVFPTPYVVAVCLLLVVTASCLARTAAPRPSAAPVPLSSQTGLASYYGPRLHGERTASGEIFNQHALVAAHPTLPFGTVVRVVNRENGRAVQLRIVDRGPAREHQRRGIIIDVSTAAARRLGFVTDGIVRVRVEVLKIGAER